MLDTRIALMLIVAFVAGVAVGFFFDAMLTVARRAEDDDRW